MTPPSGSVADAAPYSLGREYTRPVTVSVHDSDPTPVPDGEPGRLRRFWRKLRTYAGRLLRHPGSTIVLFLLAIVFYVAWRLELVPLSTVWGDLGTWVAAVFTGGGLVFAGLSAKSAADSVRAQTQQRKEQEIARQNDETAKRTAMAHSVAVSSWWAKDWNDEWCACYRIVNKSPYPISQVTVRVWDIIEDDDWSEKAYRMTHDHPEYDVLLGRVVGTMLPDDELAEAVRIEHPMAGPRPFGLVVDVVTVHFVDVWGDSWARTDTSTTPDDGPYCMCQGCIDSVPEGKMIPIWAKSPERPTKLMHPQLPSPSLNEGTSGHWLGRRTSSVDRAKQSNARLSRWNFRQLRVQLPVRGRDRE